MAKKEVELRVAYETRKDDGRHLTMPGETVALPAAEADALIARGQAVAKRTPAAAPQEATAEEIEAVLPELSEEEWGADGKPNVDVLAKRLGKKVRAGVRDEALARHAQGQAAQE